MNPITITDGTNDATFDGTTYASDNPSFELWLSTAFPATTYADTAAQIADLEAHGLTAVEV